MVAHRKPFYVGLKGNRCYSAYSEGAWDPRLASCAWSLCSLVSRGLWWFMFYAVCVV